MMGYAEMKRMPIPDICRPADRHLVVARLFTDRVRNTTSWVAPSPVAGWTARDVVCHLIAWSREFLEWGAGIELPGAQSRGSSVNPAALPRGRRRWDQGHQQRGLARREGQEQWDARCGLPAAWLISTRMLVPKSMSCSSISVRTPMAKAPPCGSVRATRPNPARPKDLVCGPAHRESAAAERLRELIPVTESWFSPGPSGRVMTRRRDS